MKTADLRWLPLVVLALAASYLIAAGLRHAWRATPGDPVSWTLALAVGAAIQAAWLRAAATDSRLVPAPLGWGAAVWWCTRGLTADGFSSGWALVWSVWLEALCALTIPDAETRPRLSDRVAHARSVATDAGVELRVAAALLANRKERS